MARAQYRWCTAGNHEAPASPDSPAGGYIPLTFDSPGHGDSQGDSTTILDYLVICQALHERYGAFDAVVAHSFGVLCAFYAVKQTLRTRCVIALSGVSDWGAYASPTAHPRV